MTALDAFEPRGEKLHPYDLFDMMNYEPVRVDKVENLEDSPRPADEADYRRNINKMGTVILVNGEKLYFLTTSIQPKTTRFV